MTTQRQWMMFFYLQTIEDCHYDLVHEGLNIWEYLEENAELQRMIHYSFNVHILLLSTSLWQN